MYHILIVDEEEHLLWALERNLFPERDDVAVHTAKTGEQGLEILEEESIDLLISDIKMPGDIDGFQLILRAKEMVPDARIMIITAFGTNRIQNFAERIGISHYIEKPFTVDELRSAVLEVLDEQEGFQGVLSDLELTDIIQMLCLAKRTALLHLKHRDRRGRIVFDAGDVVHAEFDGEVGAEAVYEMLSLRQGDIFMQSDFEPVERTIDIGWQDLLLEGVKRTDEARMEEQRERTRQEMGGPADAGAQPGVGPAAEDGDSEADDEAGEEPSRTKTPMGMGAPTMEEEDAEAETSDGLGEESSEGMLFSEEELEEINKASEAAIEEESEELTSSSDVDEQSEPEPEADDGTDDPEPAVEAGDDEGAEVDDETQPDEPAGASDDPGTDEQSGAAPRLGAGDSEADQQNSQPDGGDVATRPPERSGAFAQAPPAGGTEGIDNGVPRGAEATLGADGDAEPPVDSTGPFASTGQIEPDTGGGSGGPDSEAEQTGGDPAAGAVAQQPAPAGEGPPDPDAQPAEPAESQPANPAPSDHDPEVDAETDPPEASPGGEASQTSAPQESWDGAGTPDDQAESDSESAPPAGDSGGTEHPEPVAGSGALTDFVEECPGLKATVLVSVGDQAPVEIENRAYGEEFDAGQLASGLTDMFSRATRAVEAFRDDDELRELQLVLDDDYLLLRAVEGTELVQAAIVDKEVSLGVALVLMREFGDELQE